jgi:acyl-CoA thioesterase
VDAENIDIEKIRLFFEDDRYAMRAGVRIVRAAENAAECSLTLNAFHLNAGGAVQGGAIYTLADFTFAVAANAGAINAGQNARTVTLSSNICYLKAPRGGRLIAKATCLSIGKRISVYRVLVSDDLKTSVADVTINGYRSDF